MSIYRGGGIGSQLLGVIGMRAGSNFYPMGGVVSNRGVEGNGPFFGVQGM